MRTIVGIGELLWDVFPDGRKMAGGAPFNFVVHCHQLGHPAVMVSRVGDDPLGCELRSHLRDFGLSDEYIQTDPLWPTGTVQVQVDDQGQPSYAINMQSAWSHLEWTQSLDELSHVAAVCCHGTLALTVRGTSRAVVGRFASAVAERGQLTIYDANLRAGICEQPDSDAMNRSQWIKVNREEAEQFLATSGQPFQSVIGGKAAGDRVGIVTCGSQGAELWSAGTRYFAPAPPTTVLDTVGAGDAFTAAMTCYYLEGHALSECLRFANAYAAFVCRHQGATPRIDRRDVERSIAASSQ